MLKEYDEIKDSGFKKFETINENFKLFLKQWYLIVWSVNKKQIVKAGGLYRQKIEEECFYQTVWFALVENQDVSKSKKLADF